MLERRFMGDLSATPHETIIGPHDTPIVDARFPASPAVKRMARLERRTAGHIQLAVWSPSSESRVPRRLSPTGGSHGGMPAWRHSICLPACRPFVGEDQHATRRNAHTNAAARAGGGHPRRRLAAGRSPGVLGVEVGSGDVRGKKLRRRRLAQRVLHAGGRAPELRDHGPAQAGSYDPATFNLTRSPGQQYVPGRRLRRACVQAEHHRLHRRQADQSGRREPHGQDHAGERPGEHPRGAAAAAQAAAVAPDDAAERVSRGALRNGAAAGHLPEQRARRHRHRQHAGAAGRAQRPRLPDLPRRRSVSQSRPGSQRRWRAGRARRAHLHLAQGHHHSYVRKPAGRPDLELAVSGCARERSRAHDHRPRKRRSRAG